MSTKITRIILQQNLSRSRNIYSLWRRTQIWEFSHAPFREKSHNFSQNFFTPPPDVMRICGRNNVQFRNSSLDTRHKMCMSSCVDSLLHSKTLAEQPVHSIKKKIARKMLLNSRKLSRGYERRSKSSASNHGHKPKPQCGHSCNKILPNPKIQTILLRATPVSQMENTRISKLAHRPSKEELLSAATGFWSRLKIRFKWFSIRSVGPWNVDDWSAFVSWFVLGNIVWILVGTTTFFSLVILSINTVVAQGMFKTTNLSDIVTDSCLETLARWIGDYLTHSSGIKVVFESAVVPKWKDGVITFHNVFVSRRPGLGKTKVIKGSSMSAAVAAAERHADSTGRKEEEEDINYTQFDLTIATINVTLSFIKWWNGKGLLRDVEVKGVRGIVDRTSVNWGDDYVDPRSYLHEHNPGDFEIDSFRMEDLLITVYQSSGFRPFSISIFSCDLSKLRKQWLFYDFLSANHMSGAFDGSLFNIHPRQIHGLVGSYHEENKEDEKNLWKKQSRLRIDGLKIDHLNRGVAGPFGWIHEGNVDIVADISFPADVDESISKVVSDLYDRMEATVSAHRYLQIPEGSSHAVDVHSSEETDIYSERLKAEEKQRFTVMELKVHLNDVKAAVPLFTRDLSYINQALIRPIVAYINNKRTFIPIYCRIVKYVSEFDGSWTIYDSGLMEDLSAETYEAFAKDVVDSQARMRRLKKVGFWSISLAIQALFMGLAGNVA